MSFNQNCEIYLKEMEVLHQGFYSKILRKTITDKYMAHTRCDGKWHTWRDSNNYDHACLCPAYKVAMNSFNDN
jgi:hypothetical protein